MYIYSLSIFVQIFSQGKMKADESSLRSFFFAWLNLKKPTFFSKSFFLLCQSLLSFPQPNYGSRNCVLSPLLTGLSTQVFENRRVELHWVLTDLNCSHRFKRTIPVNKVYQPFSAPSYNIFPR